MSAAPCDGKLHVSDSATSLSTVGGLGTERSQENSQLPRDSSMETIGESNVQSNMAAIAQMSAEQCGLPLQLFCQVLKLISMAYGTQVQCHIDKGSPINPILSQINPIPRLHLFWAQISPQDPVSRVPRPCVMFLNKDGLLPHPQPKGTCHAMVTVTHGIQDKIQFFSILIMSTNQKLK